jgi:hypothetical protein
MEYLLLLSSIFLPTVPLSRKKIKIYEIIILPVRCTFLFTSREEHRLRIFENRRPRNLFVCKREEVKGGCRKLLNKLYILRSSAVVTWMTKEKCTRRTVCEMGEILVQNF